jgi:hypothetical protein
VRDEYNTFENVHDKAIHSHWRKTCRNFLKAWRRKLAKSLSLVVFTAQAVYVHCTSYVHYMYSVHMIPKLLMNLLSILIKTCHDVSSTYTSDGTPLFDTPIAIIPFIYSLC